ncbi:MAG TPA: hypothetical protein VFC07_07570 [Verrucomicrobiae bacterium]|nr:hypothetical protein [Verrucomicrobiae bacterium]
MRWLLILLLWVLTSGSAGAATEGRVLKVLPQLLDKKGRNSLTPSLYDRDAYQAFLRLHPAQISALRFAVQWKAKAPESEALKLRVEIRGMAHNLAPGELPRATTLEQTVHQHHWFSHWASVNLGAEEYKTFGEVTAWRVTLWDGDRLLSEKRSFLW